MTTRKTQLMEIELDRIVANPWQPRVNADPEYIGGLADNIHAVGLLQEPMARERDGEYQLAFGHSRIDAVRLLRERGLWGNTVWLKVADLSDEDMAYIALSENSQRKNLTPAEEISAWGKVLRDIPSVTIQSLADRVGVDRTTMSKNLAILDLPDSVLNLVDRGDLSVRAAREFLALRNADHCHEDQIAMVLRDLSGESRWHSKPPDYRVRTVRKSIRGLAHGRPAYGDSREMYEAGRQWRPLAGAAEGGTGRDVRFDAAAFKAEFPHHVHILPVGDESGGAEWTCAVKEWGRWSSRATREATKAAQESGEQPAQAGKAQGGKSREASDWWKLLKGDPVVQGVVGNRLKAMKSPDDLTAEDRAALGSRVEQVDPSAAIQLPQAAQPEGLTLDLDRAPNPPLFDFSRCASCTTGASWMIPQLYTRQGQLVCTNKQAWMDKQSVGMQTWVAWRDPQMQQDSEADRNAIESLRNVDGLVAKGLVFALWNFVRNCEPVSPLAQYRNTDWQFRKRYDYWPEGAVAFAALTGWRLPAPTDLQMGQKWNMDVDGWLDTAPEDFDWGLALAALLVWQARVTLGLGVDIWGVVARATVAAS